MASPPLSSEAAAPTPTPSPSTTTAQALGDEPVSKNALKRELKIRQKEERKRKKEEKAKKSCQYKR
ncbi:hypothetical protein HN51_065580 [Arachis hypogaea]